MTRSTKPPRGHKPRKLEEEDVHDIRRLWLEGLTLHSIAATHGISVAMVHAIAHGTRWGWLPWRTKNRTPKTRRRPPNAE